MQEHFHDRRAGQRSGHGSLDAELDRGEKISLQDILCIGPQRRDRTGEQYHELDDERRPGIRIEASQHPDRLSRERQPILAGAYPGAAVSCSSRGGRGGPAGWVLQSGIQVGPKPHEEAALGPGPSLGRVGDGARRQPAGAELVHPSGPLAGVRRGFSVSRRVASRRSVSIAWACQATDYPAPPSSVGWARP
jgi:hypothetical protein